MAYSKPFLASYSDFEEYFEAFKDPVIGITTVVIGDYDDAQKVQNDAVDSIYPLLFVHIPRFTTFNSGGNKNRFHIDFWVLVGIGEDRLLRREKYNGTRNIVQNIQQKLEADAEKGVFDFNGKMECEPKTNISIGNCIGWLVEIEISTQGVGIDSDYRN